MTDKATKTTTLDNLMAAFNGESNAHVRYVAFAKKADAEGFGQVASLFRAAARAEEIHAANHAVVINKLGGVPKADIQPTEIKSTKENLAEAIKGETYEKDVMYPEFIVQATAEANKAALRTFNYALAAEIEHAALYAMAMNDLENWKTGTREFYVCPVCGKTVFRMEFEKCPVCQTSKERFEKVS